jgi:hypothetical protein
MKLSDAYPSPPLHNLLLPHVRGYMDPADERACPPECPYRVWAEQYRTPAPSPGQAPGKEDWRPGDPLYPEQPPQLTCPCGTAWTASGSSPEDCPECGRSVSPGDGQ